MIINFQCTVLNLGGGFGIKYTEEDTPLEPSVYVKEMINVVKDLVQKRILQCLKFGLNLVVH